MIKPLDVKKVHLYGGLSKLKINYMTSFKLLRYSVNVLYEVYLTFSPSKRIYFICFNESPLKIIKMLFISS